MISWIASDGDMDGIFHQKPEASTIKKARGLAFKEGRVRNTFANNKLNTCQTKKITKKKSETNKSTSRKNLSSQVNRTQTTTTRMDELQTLINEVQIATSDLAVFISGKGIDKLVFKQVLSDDEYASSKAEVLAGLKDPTEIGTIQEWSLLFKAESKNKELKAKLIRTEAKAKHEKLKQLKKMVGVMTKTLQSGAASEYKARPMVAPAIDSAEPKAWLGQKDKRTIRTFIEEVETFVTVTKCP